MTWWGFVCGFASGAVVMFGIFVMAAMRSPDDPPGPPGAA